MRVRTIFLAALGFAGIVAAAAATETPRAPGAYASLTTPGAAACAHACAQDGICMAWSYRDENQCQLSAVVPRERDRDAVAFGFAARAPAFLQRPTPVQAEAAIELAQPAPASLGAHASARAPDDNLLLGGPLEGDLRLSLR